MDISLLLSTGRFSLSDAMNERNKESRVHAHSDLETFEYVARGKFHLRALDTFFKDLNSDCYRVKGFVQFVEKPQAWYLVQKAGARITIEEWKGEEPQQSRLVFIGRNFQTSILYKLLDAATDAPRSVLFQ